MKLEWIGWVATALFAGSYFFKQPLVLRKVQAGAALLWVVYGLIIHAFPVVVANVVVASVALYSGWGKPAACSCTSRGLAPLNASSNKQYS
jgi:hypothetical protein